jgi:hypothetical protein
MSPKQERPPKSPKTDSINPMYKGSGAAAGKKGSRSRLPLNSFPGFSTIHPVQAFPSSLPGGGLWPG